MVGSEIELPCVILNDNERIKFQHSVNLFELVVANGLNIFNNKTGLFKALFFLRKL